MTESQIQKIRVFDFLILGPLMAYAATGEKLSPALKGLLFVSAIGTILLNYHEWKKRR